MAHEQSTYTVNCEACGCDVAVRNPRLKGEPLRVWTTDFGLCLSDRIEIVRLHCSACGKQVWVKFEYEHSMEKPWMRLLRSLHD